MPQYTVHAFVVVRVKLPTEAPSRKAAARAVAEQTDFASLLPCRADIEYAEEVLGALVEVEGEADFQSSRYYRYRELQLHSTKKGKGEERANERQDRHSHRKP